MSGPSLRDLIAAGQIEAAVRLAADHAVSWVGGQLDYDTLDEHADQASIFLQTWVPGLPPLSRLEAAEWAAGQYVTALVHLDHATSLAATLLLPAQQAATRALAESLRGSWVLADGPDGELDPEVARRLTGCADTLDRLDLPSPS